MLACLELDAKKFLAFCKAHDLSEGDGDKGYIFAHDRCFPSAGITVTFGHSPFDPQLADEPVQLANVQFHWTEKASPREIPARLMVWLADIERTLAARRAR